ncbi:mycothiol system anti-sigma-R factor [Nocardioides sp.]|uniref:mycothiol system anti-sigma-R factor n=1 Tax=Nocardioides sp. TaxID=35761 RepID=UPI0035658C95
MTQSHDHSHDEPSDSDCADYLERIVYFIDNELDEADCSVVREHLDSCNPCLEKYQLQSTVKSVVARSCSETAPNDLRERVVLRLRAVQARISETD